MLSPKYLNARRQNANETLKTALVWQELQSEDGAQKTSEVPRGIKKDLQVIVNPAAPVTEVSWFPWRKPEQTAGIRWVPGKEQEPE